MLDEIPPEGGKVGAFQAGVLKGDFAKFGCVGFV